MWRHAGENPGRKGLNWSPFDCHAMARALRLAGNGRFTTDPNPRVACVLAKGDRILAEAWHERAGEDHAEPRALANTQEAKGSSCYVTLEPCSHHGRTPPCVQALSAAGVRRVIVAMKDPNPRVAGHGIQQLRAAGVEVGVGLMEQEARQLNPGFIKRMEQGLPWVRVKLAMSLDGRIGLANGQSRWLSSRESRDNVHRLRAGSSAILTGAGTVLADNPQLSVRGFDAPFQSPLRVILDSRLRTPPQAKVLCAAGRTLIFTGSRNEKKIAALKAEGAEICTLPSGTQPDMATAVLQQLASEEQVNEVLVEAGGTLSGALAQSGTVDELILYLAPILLGHRGQAALQLPEYLTLDQCPQWHITDLRPLGGDLRLTARPRHAPCSAAS